MSCLQPSPTRSHLLSLLNEGVVERLNADTNLTISQQHHLLKAEFLKFGATARTRNLPLDQTMTIAAEAFETYRSATGSCLRSRSPSIAAGDVFAAVASGYYEDDRMQQPTSNDDVQLLDHQLDQLTALHKIGRAATASSHPAELLKVAVEVIAETTKSDAVAVFLFDQSSEILALWAARGFNPSSVGALNLPMTDGLTGLAATTRAPVVETDAQSHSAWVTSHNFGDTVYASQASIPMILESQDKLIGVLNVLTIETREFSKDDVAFLQTVANELAVSVEYARIHDQTDEKLQRTILELGTLQRVSRLVASSLAESDVLRLISESAAEICDAEATALFRLRKSEPGRQSEKNPVVEHRVGQRRQAADLTQRDEFVRKVIESGSASTMMLDYVDGPSRLYGIPLRSAREIWGALCVRLKPHERLSEEQLGLLQAFTDFASLAIENAELFEEARKSAAVAETLLQEMHHRVRNNLQTVAALLSLQIRQIDNEETAHHLREAASRVQSIGAVHDLLSDEARLGGATIQAIARTVVDEVRTTLVPPGMHVDFEVKENGISVSSRQATILALLINELVSNAISHGFRQRSTGRIAISAQRHQDHALLAVENDGEQVDKGFNPSMSSGLGLRIVERLTEFDLGGTFEIARANGGTSAEIRFPMPSAPD